MKLNWKRNLVIAISVITLLLPLGRVKAGALEDQLADLQNQISQIQSQKDGIQSQIDAQNYTILGYNSQISSLYGDAQVYQKSIDETTLQIQQIQLTIQKINGDIAAKEAEIKKNQDTIAVLEKESKKRIDESYMKFRMIGANTEVGSNLLFTSNINSYFKNSQYKEVIQNDTNNLLVDLSKLKADLEVKKNALNEQMIEQQRQQDLVNVKSEDLKTKKGEVDAKMSVFYAKAAEAQAVSGQYQNTIAVLNDQQAHVAAQSNLIQQEIMNSYVPADNGQYVVAGTYIAQQGCTGLCTGPHLHFMVCFDNCNVGGGLKNPCDYLGPGGVCGGGGSLQWPLKGSFSYNSTFGYRCFWWDGVGNYCDFHTGIDIAGSPWNAPVFAAHDGYVHKFWDDGYGAHYIILCENINCTGLKTGYWHLSTF
ncbi:MAG: hypothetical protein ACMG57_01750 [Candidatus Dojkabacteria bacterium]